MNIERIDSFYINFPESAACSNLKVGGTGAGEKRIYVGRNVEALDEFFQFDDIEYFYTTKTDLLTYLDESKCESTNPSQEYACEDLLEYFQKQEEKLNCFEKEIVKFKFRKTYDEQNRYYLVLLTNEEFKNNHSNYDLIRNIALPRVSKLCFIKLRNKDTNKKYIYVRMIYSNDLENEQMLMDTKVVTEETIKRDNNKAKEYRKGQTEYREKLLTNMPACIFTGVTDDRILQACHIKPYSKCDENEKYDPKNGITMTPTYHVLFDHGFITFDDKNKLMVSPFLSNLNKNKLNLKDGSFYLIQNGSEKYMKYHRENIFEKVSFQNADYVFDD